MAACASWEFRFLFDLMTLRLKDYYVSRDFDLKRLSSDNKIIGFPKTDKKIGDPPNLVDHISENPQVREWLKSLKPRYNTRGEVIEVRLTNSHLHDLLLEEKEAKLDTTKKINLKDNDEYFIAKYLGYPNLETFRKEFFQTENYTGYYYSNATHQTGQFKLSITTVKSGFAAQAPPLSRVELLGFYGQEAKIRLEANFRPFKECWLARLEDNNYFLDLTIFTKIPIGEIYRLLKFPILYGSLTGLSFDRELLNMETVLIKEKEEEGKDDKQKREDDKQKRENELAILRYLNVRRNHFEAHIVKKNMDSVAELRTHHLNISTIAPYAGKHYRVLTLGPKGKIIQCRFTIRDSYEASLEVPHRLIEAPLRCQLFFDNLKNNVNTLLLWTYLDDNTIYSFVSINLAPQIEEGDIIDGYFSIANQKHRPNKVVSRYVMTIDGSVDGTTKGSGFKPCRMTRDQAHQEAAGDPILDKLLQSL